MVIENLIMSLLLKSTILILISSFAESANPEDEFNPPENVNFYTPAPKPSIYSAFMHMERISNSFLANSNIPVRIMHRDNSGDGKPAVDVMSDIGQFDFYHNTKSCAAAMFFRRTGTFMGTIDNQYVLNHVPLSPGRKYLSSTKLNIQKVYETKHQIIRQKELNETRGQEKEWKQKIVYSRVEYPDTVYIEILVIIHYDIIAKFPSYADAVSAVLVGFNSADMLFSKVKKPKIKLNIAAIAITPEKDSIHTLVDNSCYESLYDPQFEELNIECTIFSIQQFLAEHENIFPLSSYDVIVFLTGHDLSLHLPNPNNGVRISPTGGYGHTPFHEDYEGYKLTTHDVRIAVLQYLDNYQWYPVLAHELAHLFDVQHDEGDFVDEFNNCTSSIMKTDGSFCKECLYFSDSSLKQMASFFNTREACIFRNKPVSLNSPQKPTLKWSLDKQCQCYGHSAAQQSTTSSNWYSYLLRLLNWQSNPFCMSRLECINRKRVITLEEEAGIYMDNSECGDGMVCFQGKCQRLGTT